jgi:hypothetical protein
VLLVDDTPADLLRARSAIAEQLGWPVLTAADGRRLRGNAYYASVDWFRPDARRPRRFVVYVPTNQPLDGVDDRSAAETFGPPARSAQIGPYRVLIWDKDLTGQLGPAS